MLDLSDGLALDAVRLARASGVCLELDAAALPVAPETAAVAHALGISPAELAATGGEDYELCFCVPEAARQAAEAAAAVSWIGRAAGRRAGRALARRSRGCALARLCARMMAAATASGSTRYSPRSMRSRSWSMCAFRDPFCPNRRPVPGSYRAARAVMWI